MGKIEQVQPIVVEHKKTADINEIQEKLKSLRNENIIEASYDEKE